MGKDQKKITAEKPAVESAQGNNKEADNKCLRMSLSSTFGEQYRQELIEAGENPDDYFKPIEPRAAAVYYFPNGLH